VVDGDCVASGTRGPAPCDICDPVRDRGGWSFNEGGSCDDGAYCTVDEVCFAGACRGSPRVCDDGVGCNGVSTCDEAAGACTPFVDLCGEGSLCGSDGQCVIGCEGCAIEGSCVPSGAEQPGNPCRVCDPEQSTTEYAAAVGKACCAPAGACFEEDVCDAAGVCVPGAPVVCPLDLVCDPSNGACSCTDGQWRCGDFQLQLCIGGNYVVQDNCRPGTRCDAVAQRCVCDEDDDPNTTLVEHPSLGCGVETRVNGDRWVVFPNKGVDFDPINGNAWASQGLLRGAELAAVCADLNIEGITGWRLPTIDEARTMIAGCPSAVACPVTDPGCLSSDCGRCEACTALGGPAGGDYCRPGINLCANIHTTSPCTDCTTAGFTWTYVGDNGGFTVNSVDAQAGAFCFRPGVSLL
jgi:hypothetical protein